MTSKDYVEHDGVYCPACGSEHADAGGFVRRYCRAEQLMTCKICDSDWVEVYKLKGYVGLTKRSR